MNKNASSITMGARADVQTLANLYRFYLESGTPCLTQGTLIRRALEDFAAIVSTRITPVESDVEAASILVNAFRNTKTDPKLLLLLAEDAASNAGEEEQYLKKATPGQA